MAVQTPLFLQKTGVDADVSYSATNYRLSLIKALMPTSGVVDPYGSNSLLVTQRGAGANFSVDVSSGYAFIPGADVSNQGTYAVFNDATVNVVTPSAPGSGTRVHRLVLQIRDKLNNGAYTTYDGILSLLQDTGSGTPATPASAISLATVSISAGQANVSNANITDTRAWTRQAISYAGTLSPSSGWSSSDASRPASYRHTADGFVTLHGFLTRTSSLAVVSGAFQTFASGIPAQARPTGNRDMICSTSGGAGYCHVFVGSDGLINFLYQSSFTLNAGDWISLDGICYKVGA